MVFVSNQVRLEYPFPTLLPGLCPLEAEKKGGNKGGRGRGRGRGGR